MISRQTSTSPEMIFSRLFRAADLNDDGRISLDELNSFLDVAQVVQQRLRLASDFQRQLDGNTDGSLDLNEWMNYRKVYKNYDLRTDVRYFVGTKFLFVFQIPNLFCENSLFLKND